MENARIEDRFYAHEKNENILVGGFKSCALNNTLQVVTLQKPSSGDGMLWTSECATRVVTSDHYYAPFNTLPSSREDISRATLHTLANN